MVLDFSFTLNYTPKNLIIGIPVWDTTGNMITAFNSDYDKLKITIHDGTVTGKLLTQCVFNPNDYYSIISIVDGGEFLYRQLNHPFSVEQKERVFGFVSLQHTWSIYE
jgi:hypothetical protein